MNIDPSTYPDSDLTQTSPGASNIPEPSLRVLIGGVLADIQKLIGQHLDMFQNEIRDDFRKTKDAGLLLAWSAGIGATGSALIVAMLIGFLSWAMPTVPWWGWCGILGSALLLGAAALFAIGRRKFGAFNPLPDESMAAMKGSAEWITSHISSERE